MRIRRGRISRPADHEKADLLHPTKKSQNLAKLSRRYGLPPMEYDQNLQTGDGIVDWKTGKIHLSESLRFASEAEVLRVALYAVGYARTEYRFRHVAMAVLFAGALLGPLDFYLLVFTHFSDTAISQVMLPVVLAGIVVSYRYIYPKKLERDAHRWAREHWPSRLSAQGIGYDMPSHDEQPVQGSDQ